MTKDTIIKQALEALKKVSEWPDGGNHYGQGNIKRFAKEALAALSSEQQEEAQPKRDREADRARFTEPEFNKWLDDGVSDCGYTVWDMLDNTHDAWNGWMAHHSYAAPVQPASKLDEQAIKREARNRMTIEGHLNDALDAITRSDSPDGKFCILGNLVDKAIAAALDAEQQEEAQCKYPNCGCTSRATCEYNYNAAPSDAPQEQPKLPAHMRRSIERAMEDAKRGMQLNDGKERITLPGGTLAYLLRLVDAAPVQPAKPEVVAWMKEHGAISNPTFTSDPEAAAMWERVGQPLIPLCRLDALTRCATSKEASEAAQEHGAAERLAQFEEWITTTGALGRDGSWYGELQAIVAGRGEPAAAPEAAQPCRDDVQFAAVKECDRLCREEGKDYYTFSFIAGWEAALRTQTAPNHFRDAAKMVQAMINHLAKRGDEVWHSFKNGAGPERGNAYHEGLAEGLHQSAEALQKMLDDVAAHQAQDCSSNRTVSAYSASNDAASVPAQAVTDEQIIAIACEEFDAVDEHESDLHIYKDGYSMHKDRFIKFARRLLSGSAKTGEANG